MHRLRFVLVMLAALAPAQAFAQASNLVSISKDGDPVINQQTMLFVTAADCLNEVKFRFELKLQSQTNLQNTILQAWTAGTNVDCRQPDNREAPTGGSCEDAPCTLADQKPIGNASSDLNMVFEAPDLFGDGETCPSSGRIRVTFVAVDNDSCATGSAAENLFQDEYRATFELRTQPPGTPTNVKVTDGNSTLRASWKAEGQNTDRHTVYVDTDPGDVCSNTMLMEGMPASEADALVDMIDELTVFETRGNSQDLLTDNLGIEVGGFAAVFVSTEDRATNRSDLSEMGCGERIVTEGVLGAVDRTTGKDIQSCSGAGSSTAAGRSAAALMGLLGLWLVRRRRGSQA